FVRPFNIIKRHKLNIPASTGVQDYCFSNPAIFVYLLSELQRGMFLLRMTYAAHYCKEQSAG
ncbi:MAG: hypothetical protein P8Y28_07230, partial [Gammaproteobacteria bacterium]